MALHRLELLRGVEHGLSPVEYMPESPFLFSSVVPASDSCFELQLRGRALDDPKPTPTVAQGMQSGSRRTPPSRLDFQLFAYKIGGTKPECI